MQEQDKNIKIQGGLFISEYQNQYELLEDYFELIDLFKKRWEIQRSVQDCQLLIAEYDFPDVEERPQPPQKSEKLLKDLKIIKYKIDEKENVIRERLELSKEKVFPIMKIKNKYKLDDVEFKILIVSLYKEVNTFDFRRIFTINEILRALFNNMVETIEARKYFYNNSKLCKKNLIIVDRGRRDTFGSTEVYASEKVIEKVLGHKKKQSNHLFEKNRYIEAIKPKITFKQVMLKENIKNEILSCLSQVKQGRTIFKRWGFDKVIKYGKGITILFSGPSGTGKTMTASAIANYLNKKLCIADISRIINCYVGETEKNIVRVFKEAKEQKAVLFFDEADSLFYSRLKEAQRAVDVAYNQSINVILQEIEKFDGVVILATNKSTAMDEALERRISLKVEFEIPDIELREKIWRNHIPDNAPLDSDVNFTLLAKDFQFAGGNVKNVVLNAARVAVSRGQDSKITMDDLKDAAIKEINGSKFFRDDRKMGFRKVN